MKLKDIFGITTYWVYGGGKGHYTTEATEKFKLHRAFVGNYVVTKGNLDLRVEPTWQNFKYDTYLKQLKDKGITTVWSTQGSFDWYGTQGKIGKVNPIKPGDDPLLQSSWADFQELVRQIAIRYADDTAHLLSEAKVFQGEPAYLSNTPKAGLGLVDYLTGTNEYTFLHGWSGAEYTLTPEMGAVQTKALIDGVRSVSKTMKIVCPSDHTPNIDNQRRLLKHLKSLYEAEGKPMPTDFYLDFHWYMRNTSQDQSGGTAGETPETINAYAHAQAMDALCEEYGLLGWLCTETGWATDNSKQSAPILEGFTREESQGILMIRLALIWGASKYCKGISFWHCRDDYDLPPYAKGGINNKDWSAKPARTICEDFLDKYGEHKASNFKATSVNGKLIYSVTVSDDTFGDRVFAWTDKNSSLPFTPMPRVAIINPTPPMRHPKKQGSTLVWSDTGERIILAELNSPETLLRQSLADFKAIVDYAVSVGLNTIYCTLYAGDKYSSTLHPYNGTKVVNGKTFGDPATGFNETTLQDWKVKLEYAASKGMILHLLLSEKENHFIRTDVQEKEFIDKMVATFGNLPIIWDREEFPLGKDNWIQVYFDYLANADPNNVIAIHNNTGEKPWIGHAGRIHLLSIQADVNSMDSIIRTQTAAGFAVYSSEGTGTHAVGDTTRAAKLRDAGGNLSSGAGIYIAPLDQDATLAQLKQYDSVFKILSGTTTPNPNPMRNAYLTALTTVNNDAAVKLIEGTNVGVGKYAIYVDGANGVELELFKDDVSFIAKRREGVPPLAVGGDDNGRLRLVDFPAGKYRLVIGGQEDISFINFTVGTVTPPPTEVKGTTFVKTIDGKVKFNFEDGIPITL